MNILFINPSRTIKKGNIWHKIVGVIPPIGLAQLASVAESMGAAVQILDTLAESLDHSQIKKRLLSIKTAPDYIGITATTVTVKEAIETAKIAREVFKTSKIIFGGVHPSIFPEEILANDFIDLVVRNEGEETLKELILGKKPAEITGLSYKENSKIINNPGREQLVNVNELPLPAYHLLPMNKYRLALGSYKKLPGIGIITTRGCPGKCTFCLGQYLGTKIRMRSAEKIYEEIRLLHDKYGVMEIAFYDDTFTAFKQNVMGLCKLLIDSKIGISWSCFARVDFIDENLLNSMKKAGCHQICFGVESASEEILKNIKKNISLEKAKTAIALTKKTGIEARATFMLGNPGETIETMESTLEFALKLEPDIALFNITTHYPGTEMYDWAIQTGNILTKDWSRYDFAQSVINIPGLDPCKIKEFYKKAYLKFYTRPKYIIKRLLRFTEININIRGLLAVIDVLIHKA